MQEAGCIASGTAPGAEIAQLRAERVKLLGAELNRGKGARKKTS